MNLNRYDGTVVVYPTSELAALLTRLIAQGQPSCLGNDDIAIVRVDSVGLLLIDVAWTVGRRLYELYSPVSDSTMPFGLRWTLQGQGAYTLNQALSGPGYVGLVTVPSLSLVHMMLFTGISLPYLEVGQLVAAQGFVENSPARLMTIAAGSNIALTTAGEVITISTSADATSTQLTDGLKTKQDTLSAGNPAGDHEPLLVGSTILSLTASNGIALTTDGIAEVNISGETLAKDIKDLQDGMSAKQDAILSLPSAPGSGQYDIFDGSSIKSLSAAAPLSITANGTNLALALNSSGFAPASTTYSKLEVDGALKLKQDKLTVTSPLALSLASVLSVDLSSYALASALTAYALASSLVAFAYLQPPSCSPSRPPTFCPWISTPTKKMFE